MKNVPKIALGVVTGMGRRRWIDRVLVCRIPGSGRGVPDEETK